MRNGLKLYSDISGNALFLILIAVALFAALSYAVTNPGRGGGGIDKEQAQIDAAVNDQCNASVDAGRMRLTIIGDCVDREISYELSDGSNVNPAAPTDKSCHIFDAAGAGVAECGAYLLGENPCMQALGIGDSCNGVIYAGMSGGNRLYTTPSNQGPGTANWASGSYNHSTGATSTSDGLFNTNRLMETHGDIANFWAARRCANLGEKWYLPATNEMTAIRSNASAIGSFPDGTYWASTETANHAAAIITIPSGTNVATKNGGYLVRCVRRD